MRHHHATPLHHLITTPSSSHPHHRHHIITITTPKPPPSSPPLPPSTAATPPPQQPPQGVRLAVTATRMGCVWFDVFSSYRLRLVSLAAIRVRLVRVGLVYQPGDKGVSSWLSGQPGAFGCEESPAGW
ncbi:hypothetical protein Tco_0997332, partial [Tanacetum coccineum]